MNKDIKISDVNLPETAELFRAVMKKPEKMFEMLKINLKETAEKAVTELIKMELTGFLGRSKYERNGKSGNSRNGKRKRTYTTKGIGTLKIDIARDRKSKFTSKLIARYDRYDKELEGDMLAMFLSGMSTRNVTMFSSRLLGREISPTEVSNASKEIMGSIEKWRTRSLKNSHIKYLIIDGVNFKMRVKNHVEKVPMLIVIGVTHSNERIFLTIQQGDKDSATTWREIFKDMKQVRGLNKNEVQLGIMDGLPGLEKVFKEEFQSAKVQRCTVHVARNVLSKVPKSLKEKVSDKLRDIFYAADKKSAIKNYEIFAAENQKTIPSAVDCLKRSIRSCLTFFSFPKDEWISLRTTNAIERVNKEFKRRTKPMEILAGEKSAYLLLSFIAYKMELNWKKAPFGKKNYLPALAEFTHKT